MSFDISYSLLFEVNFFHNYYLNDGESLFENMASDQQNKMLLKYDFSNFISVSPSIATSTVLKNFKMHFKKTKTGFRIYIKVKQLEENDPLFNRDPFIETPTNLELIFGLKITNPLFENFTDLPFSQNQLFYFSNRNPLRVEANNPIPDPNPKKEVFNPLTFNYLPLISDNTLISDDFLASVTETNNLLPDFDTSESRGLFGILSVTMEGHDVASSILNTQKKINTPIKEFMIHFDNRKTFWKYINPRTSSEIETNSEKPLTFSGFVEIDPETDFTPAEPAVNQYPNPSPSSIKKIANKIYSEIFI